jgi:DNA-directed RNA polymerase beta' subunit
MTRRKSRSTSLVQAQIEPLENHILQQGIKDGNQLALQVSSGSRGNKTNLRQLMLGDMLVQDHRGRTIPVPILHGYGAGLDPVEYWAGSYGARQGTASTKFATRDAGDLGKQLATIAHRLVVSEKDCNSLNGMPVKGGDSDNVGAVLAQPRR